MVGTAKGRKELQGPQTGHPGLDFRDHTREESTKSKLSNASINSESAFKLIELGALLYCSVDATKALQGDRTLTRDVDSIVDKKQLLQELMRPKLRRDCKVPYRSSFAYGFS